MSDGTQQVRDELFALRLRHGEPKAFHELVQLMERPLLYYLAKLVGNDAALDVLQDVWLAAFRATGRLDNPRQLRPWLYRMARGRAIDRVRKDRSETRLRQIYAEDALDAPGDEPTFGVRRRGRCPSGPGCPRRPAPGGARLHFLEDLSVAEIARVVGCPVGTVKSRIYHAKRVLRAALPGR